METFRISLKGLSDNSKELSMKFLCDFLQDTKQMEIM